MMEGIVYLLGGEGLSKIDDGVHQLPSTSWVGTTPRSGVIKRNLRLPK